jgi:hypothetical protein
MGTKKTRRPSNRGFFDSLTYFFVASVVLIFNVLGGKWPQWIEESSWWKRILWVTATNDFAKEHDPLLSPDATAVSFFKLEILVFTLIVLIVALPGPSPVWIMVLLIFVAWVCDRIRSVTKNTYGGAKISFDTGGKVLRFVIFGGLYGSVIAILVAQGIAYLESIVS